MGGIVSNVIGGVTGALGLASGADNTGLAAQPNITKQNDLIQQIGTANQNVQGNIGNQNAFAQTLQNQMNGAGPNLANSQLANATGQNVSSQAALMASQRGTGSNAGLIARQAAQQGAGIQQQAAGQAAVNRQSQMLGAQSQLGNVYGQIGQEAGQNLSTQQGALANQNNVITQGTTATNNTNATVGMDNTKNRMGAISGIGQGLGGLFAEGGPVKYSQPLHPHIDAVSQIYHPHMHQTQQLAKGGQVKALVSPGEDILKPKDVKKVAEGKADPTKIAEKVPGKPKVPGAVNSYANDTVSKKLAVGSIVLPRSVTQSDNPSKNAAAFVQAVVEKGKKKVKK